MVPLLAANDVKRAVMSLNRAIDSILTSSRSDITDTAHINFDATQYFFLSHRVARLFPNLWESEVVLSYRSSRPPQHLSYSSGHMQREIVAGNQRSWVINMATQVARAFISTLTSVALLFGTVDIHLQKAIITVVQPTILAGICFAYYDIVNGDWIIAVACAILFGSIFYQFRPRSASIKSAPSVQSSDDAMASDFHWRTDCNRSRNFRSENLQAIDLCSESQGVTSRPEESGLVKFNDILSRVDLTADKVPVDLTSPRTDALILRSDAAIALMHTDLDNEAVSKELRHCVNDEMRQATSTYAIDNGPFPVIKTEEEDDGWSDEMIDKYISEWMNQDASSVFQSDAS